MPDVGVLSLQIQDNSQKAIDGLSALEGVLVRVRNAVGDGMKLSTVAVGLKRIGTVVNENISGSTLVKIGQLADELSKLNGLGSLKITVSGTGAVESVAETVRKAEDSITGINTGFEDVGARVAEARDEMDDYSESAREASEATKDLGTASGKDLSQIPATDGSAFKNAADELAYYTQGLERSKSDLEDATEALAEYKQRFAETGEEQWAERIKQAESCIESANRKIQEFTDSIASVSSHVDSFAEGMGKIPEAVETVAESGKKAIENAVSEEEENARKFAGICYEMREEAAKAQAVLQEQIEAFNAPAQPKYSLEQTNSMADNLTQLDLLKAKLAEAEAAFNNFANELGLSSSKTVKAGLAVSELRDKIWEYTEALREAAAVPGSPMTDAIEGSRGMENMISAQERVRQSSDTATGSLKDLDKELRSKKTDSEEAASGFRMFRNEIHQLRGGIGRLLPTLTGLVRRFRSMIIMRSLRYMIRQLAAGFREGVENVYNYSRVVGTSLAPAMDQAASALQTMRNSIGAAVAPVIEALVPVLQNVVNWFINAMNYANQFFALLNGQSSWTRALPAQANAFENSSKSAKKASNSMKELLADWDELNIIQSESGSGGSGNTTSDAEYSQMFEQVNQFDEGVQESISFLNDHLGGITEILKKAGIILLGWRFSRAFTGMLGTIGSLVAGGALISLGIDFTYGAGFDAGSKGYFDTQDMLRAIVGGIASAIGGALITRALGFGGAIGFGIGLTVAAIATLIGYVRGQQDLLDKNKWGGLTLSQKQIEEFVKKQFSFDADAEIDVMNAHIKDTDAAKEAVREAITTFNNSLTEAEKITTDIDTTDARAKISAVKHAAEDAQAAIKAVQSLIDANEKGITYTLTNFKFTDSEGNDISQDLLDSIKLSDATLRDYFTGIGNDLAKLILEGEKSGWKNGEMEAALELMASQKRIYDRAEELKNKMKFETETSAALKNVVDRDTAVQIYEEQKQKLQEYEDTVKETVQKEADNLTYLAALAESAAIEAGYDPETGFGPEEAQKLHEASENYKTQAINIINGMQGAIDDKLKDTKTKMAEEWKKVLLTVYGPDMIEKTSGIFNQSGSWFDWLDRLFGASTASDAVIEKWINEGGYEGAGQIMYEALKASIESVDPNGIVQFLMNDLGMPLWDILTDDMKKTVAGNITKNTASKADAYELFKSMFGLGPEEAKQYIDPLYQDIWSDIMKDVPEEEYIDLDDVEEDVRVMINPVIPEGVDTSMSMEAESLDDLNVSVDHVNFTIEEDVQKDIEDLYSELRQTILHSDFSGKFDLLGSLVDLYNNSDIDAMKELKQKIEEYGFDYSNDALKNYLNGYDWSVGKISPVGMLASAGASSVGWNSGAIAQPAGVQPEAEAIDYEQMTTSVKSGTESANRNVVEELQTIAQRLTNLLNKEWKVVVSPSAGWGRQNAQSADEWGKVTG